MKTFLVLLILIFCCAPINKSVVGQAPPIEHDTIKKALPALQKEISPAEEAKYLLAINKIERKYQIRSWKLQEKYEIYPIGMFPFFCLSKEVQCQVYPSNLKIIFLRTKYLSIGECKTDHLQIAVLHCTKGKIPWARIYTMHFLALDSNKIWQEEKKPISVTTILTNREGIYALQK
jgi:hypothetical protein